MASLPPTQNAIAIHGSGDGLRIWLDIPASEMAEAVKVIAWGQKVLRVTIEPETCKVFEHAATERPEGSSAAVDSRRLTIRRDK